MNEEELAAYFQARKGDTSEWSDKPVKAQIGKASAVFSVRFIPEELDALRLRAKEVGTTISGLIRSAALQVAGFPSGCSDGNWPPIQTSGTPAKVAWKEPSS